MGKKIDKSIYPGCPVCRLDLLNQMSNLIIIVQAYLLTKGYVTVKNGRFIPAKRAENAGIFTVFKDINPMTCIYAIMEYLGWLANHTKDTTLHMAHATAVVLNAHAYKESVDKENAQNIIQTMTKEDEGVVLRNICSALVAMRAGHHDYMRRLLLQNIGNSKNHSEEINRIYG